ncbi:MAG: heavy-metal-associated domain-containing protein [Gammaproteobacteria bacterium]
MNEYSVENLSCGHCIATVTRAVQALDPMATLRADLATRRVWVSADVPTEDVVRSLTVAGYPATLVAAD